MGEVSSFFQTTEMKKGFLARRWFCKKRDNWTELAFCIFGNSCLCVSHFLDTLRNYDFMFCVLVCVCVGLWVVAVPVPSQISCVLSTTSFHRHLLAWGSRRAFRGSPHGSLSFFTSDTLEPWLWLWPSSVDHADEWRHAHHCHPDSMLLGDGETSRDIPKVLLPDLLPLLPADDWGLGGLWPAVGGAELRDATIHEPRQLRMEWAATSCIRTWPVLCRLATTVSPSLESGDRMMQVEGSTWGDGRTWKKLPSFCWRWGRFHAMELMVWHMSSRIFWNKGK